MSDLDEVTGAILRAYFSRPVDGREINITVLDNHDLGQAALEAMSGRGLPFLTSSTAKITIVGNTPTTGGNHAG